MNGYDARYVFRKATWSDVDRIMYFIREHWRADHILGNNRAFFLYEHGGKESDIHFILCEDRENTELIGMHGFIPYSFHPTQRHVCGVMTMVRKNNVLPMLGVELIKRFITLTEYQTYCGIGTHSETMVPLVKRLFQRQVGKMQHYYYLNEERENFKLATIADRKKIPKTLSTHSQAKLIEFNKFEELQNRFDLNKAYPSLPYKEDWYIKKRYFDHPIYRYRVWGISHDNNIVALLMGREVQQENTKILRLVDFIGNIEVIAQLNNAIHHLIKEHQYEYADFLLHGVPEHIMNQAGFKLKKENVDQIPTYFEPFVPTNVDIWFETSHQDMIIFKADADGDRPNWSVT